MDSCIQKASAAESVTIGLSSPSSVGQSVVLGSADAVGWGVSSGAGESLGVATEVGTGLAEGLACDTGVAEDAGLAAQPASQSAAIAMIGKCRVMARKPVRGLLSLDIDRQGPDR
jgi:hypothetical protein